MSVLYAIGAAYGGRIVCTSNASEAYVGYSTKWGDGVGDLAPLRNLTTEEVCAIGIELGLPHDLVYKTPSDGMSGLSDEDKLGFKYRDVNVILRDGSIKNINTQAFYNITMKHTIAQHKLNPMPMFEPNLIEGD
jgi:NAD+ synthase